MGEAWGSGGREERDAQHPYHVGCLSQVQPVGAVLDGQKQGGDTGVVLKSVHRGHLLRSPTAPPRAAFTQPRTANVVLPECRLHQIKRPFPLGEDERLG